MAVKKLHKLKKSVLYLMFMFVLLFPVMAGADYQTNLLPGEYLTVGSDQIDVGDYSVALVYDWNNDGKKDLLLGQKSIVAGVTKGRVSYFENIGTDSNPSFNTPSYIQACSNTCTLEVTAGG